MLLVLFFYEKITCYLFVTIGLTKRSFPDKRGFGPYYSLFPGIAEEKVL